MAEAAGREAVRSADLPAVSISLMAAARFVAAEIADPWPEWDVRPESQLSVTEAAKLGPLDHLEDLEIQRGIPAQYLRAFAAPLGHAVSGSPRRLLALPEADAESLAAFPVAE